METEYLNQLKQYLLRLKNNQGHFIIQDGYFAIAKSRGNEVFCQFAKQNPKGPVTFEALSHHFDQSIDKKLESRFLELGFTLEKEGNYTKSVYLNSEDDVSNTAKEVVIILEELYKVDKGSIYDFDDQIETVNAISGKGLINSDVNEVPVIKKTISPKQVVFIILAAIICYYLFFDKNESRSSSNSSNESMYVVKDQAFATSNKHDFDDMYTYIVQNDMKALQSMVDDGTITVLQPGTDVYLMDSGLGYMVVRVSGSTQKLWIASERISKK